MNLVALFSDIAAQHGAKSAILENGKIVSYQELWNSIERLAAAFYRIGIRDHNRVALILPNSSEFIYCFFALLKNNAIVCPLNPDMTPYELKNITNNLDPHVIISINTLIDKVVNESPSLLEQKILILQGRSSQILQANKYYELDDLLKENTQACDIQGEEESTVTINYTYRGLG